jgi:hypothetical protein
MRAVRQRTRGVGLPALLLVSLVPRAAAADRGALTLEIGPAITVVRSAPSLGSGPELTGTMGGGFVGARYGVLNSLELTAAAFWEAPAKFYHSGDRVSAAGQSLQGTLAETAGRYGILAGARFVGGYVWRYHLGVEVGWSRQRFWRRDLIDVSDPANPTSYGLGLQDVWRNALVISPLAGIEWQLGNHWSMAATPRLEVLIGGVGRLAFVLPVTMGYSWFTF